MRTRGLIVRKVWRSEALTIILFFLLSAACIYLTRLFPGSVIRGPLFSLGGETYFLRLPLLWFLPAAALSTALLRIYDVRYLLDGDGIEARTGIISLNQQVTRLRYEDIRSVEFKQSIWERLLDIGEIEIGTAATSGVEIVLHGAASPGEVQNMILRERDRRQALARRHVEKPDNIDEPGEANESEVSSARIENDA